MQISVEKITDLDLARWACSLTIDKESHVALESLYENEHSPMRTQMFKVTMLNIPTFVSVHFVRHTQGVTHFVKSNREDRGGDTLAGRLTPVNHGMLVNAQALINMARKRLCYKSAKETVGVMSRIKWEVMLVDPDLANHMVAECVYRGGICHESKSCGLRVIREEVKHYAGEIQDAFR